MRLYKKKIVHFIGIGGIGMSGIAIVLLKMGYKVTGSDLELSNLTRRIEVLGGKVFEGHRSSNISSNTGMVVFSSAVSKDNPEMVEAKRLGVPIVHRAAILGELFNGRKGIAITGTHGKTTTTSLISVMLKNNDLDPTVIIGGEVEQFGGNSDYGNGPYFVAEADESDSSFLRLDPFYAVVVNIEMEHVDHYRTLDDAKKAYRAFIDNVKPGGTVFYNIDDPNIREILAGFRKKTRSFGFSKEADIYPVDIEMNGFSTVYKCVYMNRVLGTVEINVPGMHNVINSLATVLVGLTLGLPFEHIATSIKGFTGAKRRFHLRANHDDIMLIDDYAHHPTEIRAVLDTCRNWHNRRLIAIFQPHRYTRTKYLAKDFGKCFAGVDKLILTDIYAASEKAIEGVSINNIYESVKSNGLDDVVILNKKDIPGYIMRLKKPGDIILVMGAGDIKKVSDELSKSLDRDGAVDKHLVAELRKSARGKFMASELLSAHTSFKVGGPADMWVEPKDAADLRRVLKFSKLRKIPLFIIGNGSNILVNDNGFRGLVVHLGSPYFKRIDIKGTRVCVGAGFMLPKLIRTCCEHGLGGLESMVGIPGTIGGAVYMNAGGSANPIYKNIGDLVDAVRVMDYSGNIKVYKKKDLQFRYRRSNLESYIVLDATLKLEKKESSTLLADCVRFLHMKKEKQVLDMPSAGCIFKNPDKFQFTCGQMIDMLGLKGKRVGGAEISEKHANFIINRNRATCEDVIALIDYIKMKVKENYAVPLELEVKVI